MHDLRTIILFLLAALGACCVLLFSLVLVQAIVDERRARLREQRARRFCVYLNVTEMTPENLAKWRYHCHKGFDPRWNQTSNRRSGKPSGS